MKFISAIFQIYQRNSNYIGDFHNISAQLKLYQRFFDYIDLTTKRRGRSQTASSLYFGSSTRTVVPSLSCYKLKQFRYAVQQSSAQSIILNRYLLRFLPLLYPPYKTIKNTIHFFFSMPIPLSDIEIITLDSNSSTKTQWSHRRLKI